MTGAHRHSHAAAVDQAAAPADRSSWAEQAMRALAGAGYRRGGARRSIVELLDEQPCALSAGEVGDALASRERDASRASVYRVLEELEELGVLQRVEVGQRDSALELAPAATGFRA